MRCSYSFPLPPRDLAFNDIIDRMHSAVVFNLLYPAMHPACPQSSRSESLAGFLCRLQGYANDRRMKVLSDSVLFLQAQKHGFIVLTRNIVDFDTLLQLRPEGRALFYRRNAAGRRRRLGPTTSES